MDYTFFSRHLVPQNVGNIICVCYFLNIGLGSTKNQCSRHYFIWNRIEKLMPQLWNFSPQTLKTFKKLTNLFSNLETFCRNLGFQKPWICPWIFHGGRAFYPIPSNVPCQIPSPLPSQAPSAAGPVLQHRSGNGPGNEAGKKSSFPQTLFSIMLHGI